MRRFKRFRPFVLFIVFWVLIALMDAPYAGAGTWWEDFNDGDFKGWEIAGPDPRGAKADWSVKDGELVATRDFLATQLIVGTIDWKDYSIETKIKLVQRLSPPNLPLAGIVLRDQGGRGVHNNYTFDLTVDWNGKNGLLGGVIVNNFFPIETGFKQFVPKFDVWYTLKVEAKRSSFRAFLNDELAFEFEDKRFKSGKLGVIARYIQAHFDNIVIKGNEVPNKGRPFAVSSGGKLTMLWGAIKRNKF